jgi:uncharacterized protein YjiS (DUF1127 family)
VVTRIAAIWNQACARHHARKLRKHLAQHSRRSLRDMGFDPDAVHQPFGPQLGIEYLHPGSFLFQRSKARR